MNRSIEGTSLSKGSSRRQENIEAIRKNWPFPETAYERSTRLEQEMREAYVILQEQKMAEATELLLGDKNASKEQRTEA